MKVKFWRYNIELFVFWPIIALFSIALLTSGIILSIQKGLSFVLLIILGLIFFLIFLYNLFLNKRVLTKIHFSESLIKITWLKNKLYEFSWQEITDVTTTLCGKGSRYFTLIFKDTKINMIPSKKMLKTIITLCPSENIKNKVVTLFDCYLHIHLKQI